MRLPTTRTAIYIFWCRLYILLGVSSISAGLYLWWIAQSIGSDSKRSLLALVGILIFVGLLRIANSLWGVSHFTLFLGPTGSEA